MSNFREKAISLAEVVDAWRIIPRFLVALYGVLVYSLYTWYRSIETIEVQECNEALIRTLTDLGLDVHRAYSMACQAVEIIGGPTDAQNIFVTAIIGLSTAIFGLYVNSGRLWKRAQLEDSKKQPFGSGSE